jgi:hypothetical protein
VAKDGSPVPVDIDSWSLEERLSWSEEHNGTGGDNTHANGNGSKLRPNVPGPKKKKSIHGLMEFLNEGNPVQITDEKWRSLRNKEDLDEL